MSERETALKDAAEMLWVLLANVSGGDWTKQTEEWQQAAARWRDNYFAVALAQPVDAPQPCVWREAPGGAHVYAGCTPNDPYPFLREEARQFSVCPYCAQSLRFPAPPVPAAQETTK